MENINRMIHCGAPSFGGAMYGCSNCGHLKFVPFRCKSRFCPTCGNKYSIDRTTSMSFKIIHVKHRHCVFTIAEELRPFFLKDRSLLNCLFSAVKSVILRIFHKQNKSELFTPGFILVLHTFGRDLKWNPHIHCLLSEGGLGKSGLWRNVNHFNSVFMRNSFQTALLKELKKKLLFLLIKRFLRSTNITITVFMFMQNLTAAILPKSSNTSDAILTALSSPLPVSMITILPMIL